MGKTIEIPVKEYKELLASSIRLRMALDFLEDAWCIEKEKLQKLLSPEEPKEGNADW